MIQKVRMKESAQCSIYCTFEMKCFLCGETVPACTQHNCQRWVTPPVKPKRKRKKRINP